MAKDIRARKPYLLSTGTDPDRRKQEMLQNPINDEKQRELLQIAADILESLRTAKTFRRVKLEANAVEHFLEVRRKAASLIDKIGPEMNPPAEGPPAPPAPEKEKK